MYITSIRKERLTYEKYTIISIIVNYDPLIKTIKLR